MSGAFSLLVRLAQLIPRGLSMFDDIDLAELGMDEEKGAALKASALPEASEDTGRTPPASRRWQGRRLRALALW